VSRRRAREQLGYDGLAQDRLGAQARSFISGYDVDMQSALDWPGGHLRAQRRGGRLAKTHSSTGKSFFSGRKYRSLAWLLCDNFSRFPVFQKRLKALNKFNKIQQTR